MQIAFNAMQCKKPEPFVVNFSELILFATISIHHFNPFGVFTKKSVTVTVDSYSSEIKFQLCLILPINSSMDSRMNSEESKPKVKETFKEEAGTFSKYFPSKKNKKCSSDNGYYLFIYEIICCFKSKFDICFVQ